MPPFQLHTPNSLEEAILIAGELASNEQEFDWVAGGTTYFLITNGTSTSKQM